MYKAKDVAEMLANGKEFTTEEVDQIMLDCGMSEEKLREYREKGYDDSKILGLLRFCV